MIHIFTTAFIHVFLISINTIFLARMFYPGVAIAGFMISYIWVGNVKKVNVATNTERIIYSTGAMLGGLTGMMIVQLSNYISNTY
jgi:hypothetical protein